MHRRALQVRHELWRQAHAIALANLVDGRVVEGPHAVVASIPLHEGALATSGDYERYFEIEGRRYCHILDPRSGWPVQGWQSISVVAPACLAAGTITTLAMLMGEQALPFLRSQGLPFLAIDAQGQITDESGSLTGP